MNDRVRGKMITESEWGGKPKGRKRGEPPLRAPTLQHRYERWWLPIRRRREEGGGESERDREVRDNESGEGERVRKSPPVRDPATGSRWSMVANQGGERDGGEREEPLTKEVQLIRKENEIFYVKAETMTVEEVKRQRSTAKEYYVIYKVKITSINSSGSWHYQTCHSHYVKLEKDGSKYYCSKCKGFVTTPHRRFKVHVRAEDNSGSTTLTLFDSIVKIIIVAIYGSTSLFALWIASIVVGAIDAIPLACRGLRNIYSAKPSLVPIKEMTDVLSVEIKAIDISRDTWVRMKNGMYKGDLAKVVTVKLIPRIDFQALANKLEGRDVVKKKDFVPPPRFMNIEELRVAYPLEKFRNPEDGDGDMAGLSTLLANRKKGHFMRGDAITVVGGDLKILMGWVEKVEEDNVHIRPEMEDLTERTLAVNEKDLCKYFKPGDHVKVVSGAQKGATGTVVKVEGHVLILVSDTTKDDIRVFADNVVRSSEVTTGITRIGDYSIELHFSVYVFVLFTTKA
ncbi:hypothetical protein Sjap_014256 [Stephania japonica]|uniref:KOW domain-containing protein n=1 Tax=Stephania japonica TaxID=461633 RepID=A0AAP0IZF5_9MAGN